MPRACRPVELKNSWYDRWHESTACGGENGYFNVFIINSKKEDFHFEFPILKLKPWVFSNWNGIKLKP